MTLVPVRVLVGRILRPGRASRLLKAFVLLGALLSSGCTTSSYLGRWVHWRQSDIGDVERFPARAIERSGGVFRFHERADSTEIVVEVERDGAVVRTSVEELAESTGTTALIIVRRDTLLFEGYFNGYDRMSVNTSFSVAKSITSLLIGVAVDEGLIESIDDPVTRYLPELADRDPRFHEVTVRHLLNMRSGIAFRDHDLPWGDKPKAYYDPHLRERVLTRLEVAHPPGTRWVYNSYNPILLGLVLERVSGSTVAEFTEERLWQPLGMEFDASWSVDGPDAPMEKMESGLNARAIDFAKLARLVLRRGAWGDRQIISREWVAESTTAPQGCELEEFRPRRICYRRAWWLHPGQDNEASAIGAWGHLGQYIYVFPEDQILIVRFGRKRGDVSWPSAFRTLGDHLRRH